MKKILLFAAVGALVGVGVSIVLDQSAENPDSDSDSNSADGSATQLRMPSALTAVVKRFAPLGQLLAAQVIGDVLGDVPPTILNELAGVLSHQAAENEKNGKHSEPGAPGHDEAASTATGDAAGDKTTNAPEAAGENPPTV